MSPKREETERLIKWCEKASSAIYLACEASVADDISTHLKQVAEALRSSPAGGGGDGIQGPASDAPVNKEDETRLWLWRNGDHFWAFDSLYPTRMDCDDPATLGEPSAWAILKRTKSDRRDDDQREIEKAEAGIRRNAPLRATGWAPKLRSALWGLLNDCINFDGGRLTPAFMERASYILKEYDSAMNAPIGSGSSADEGGSMTKDSGTHTRVDREALQNKEED